MRSLEMAWMELRRLFSARLLRAGLLVLCMVPLLYGVLYLWAFWNPYASLDEVPVAVVNQDRAVTVDGTTVDAGHELVRKLRANRALDWRFMTAAQARQALHDQDCYMVLTIPRDYSRRLANANSDNARPATLRLETDEASNLLATQIGSSAVRQLRTVLENAVSNRYLNEIFLSINKMRSGLAKADAGSGALARGLSSGSSGADKLSKNLRKASSGSRQLTRGLGELAGGAGKVSSGAGTLAGGASTLAKGLSSAAGGAAKLASGRSKRTTRPHTLASGLATLDASGSTLTSGAATLASGAAQVSTGVSTAATQIGIAATSAATIAGGASATVSALQAYANAHPEAMSDSSFRTALGAATQVASGTATLSTGLQSSVSSAQTLASGAEQVSSGAASLSSGLSTYVAGVSSASSGAARLASGADTLSSGAATLSGGVGSASSGASTLASGAATLADATAQVSSGAGRASNAAATLTSGLEKLSVGGDKLSKGISTASRGSETLHQALAAGVLQVPRLTTTGRERRAAMMSDPVKLSTTRVDPVPDYGTGFAPYFIPLALWVGALMTYFLVRPIAPRALASTLRDPWVALSGLWAGVAVTFVQAIVMLVILQVALGLSPVLPWATYLFCLLTALTFAAILQFLSAALGTAGKFIGVVLLMLQLTSAAGTFPLETVPRFFQVINPFLPMTYVVAGLRQTISGSDIAVVGWNTLALVAFALVAFCATLATVHRQRVWSMGRLHPVGSL